MPRAPRKQDTLIWGPPRRALEDTPGKFARRVVSKAIPKKVPTARPRPKPKTWTPKQSDLDLDATRSKYGHMNADQLADAISRAASAAQAFPEKAAGYQRLMRSLARLQREKIEEEREKPKPGISAGTGGTYKVGGRTRYHSWSQGPCDSVNRPIYPPGVSPTSPRGMVISQECARRRQAARRGAGPAVKTRYTVSGGLGGAAPTKNKLKEVAVFVAGAWILYQVLS